MAEEASRDELLDNTPEAVAMRAARAKWASPPPAAPAPRGRRGWIVALALGGLLAVQAFERWVAG